MTFVNFIVFRTQLQFTKDKSRGFYSTYPTMTNSIFDCSWFVQFSWNTVPIETQSVCLKRG